MASRNISQGTNSQELVELSEDRFDVWSELEKSVKNRLSFDNLRLRERYSDGAIEFHFHILHLTKDGSAYDFYAIFEREDFAEKKLFGDAGIRCIEPMKVPGSLVFGNMGTDDSKALVLIHDVEFMQPPKHVPFPTRVWLKRANQVNRCFRGSLYFSNVSSFEFLSRIENREGGVLADSATVCLNQLTREKIEAGSKAVDNVSNLATPEEIGPLCEKEFNDVLSSLTVVLGDKSVGLFCRPSDNFICQVVEVAFGPFDFGERIKSPIWNNVSHLVKS